MTKDNNKWDTDACMYDFWYSCDTSLIFYMQKKIIAVPIGGVCFIKPESP